MEKKRCTNKNCRQLKPLHEFAKDSSKPDGLFTWCRKCNSEYELKYRSTIEGFVTRVYNSQLKNSRHRGHPPPSYPKEWLINLAKDSVDFNEKFKFYISTGRKRALAPSFDRICDDLPYTEDNIQILTFKENQDKAFADMRSGKIIHTAHPQRPIVQLTKFGEFVAEFCSGWEAYRQTGIYQQNIWKVCSGRRKYAGGFIWMYKEDYYG